MARRDEYRQFLESLGANWTEVCGLRVVRDFGNPHSEKSAITHLAIADRSERDSVIATGDDVVPLMQGLTTNNVFHLVQSGVGQRNLAVNINGRIVFDMKLLHLDGLILIDLEPGTIAEGRLGHFKKNIINEDAKFHDRSNGVAKIAVFGASVCNVLSTVFTMDENPETLPMFGGCKAVGQLGEEVIIQRIDFGDADAFELTVIAEDAKRLFTSFLERDAVPVGEEAQESLRVRKGVQRFAIDRNATLFGAELCDDIIPLEAGLHSLVDFEKGCYLGQEIIARLDSRGVPAKTLRKIETESAVGDKVTVDSKEKGFVVSCVPVENGFLTGVFMKRGFNDVGQRVLLGDQTHSLIEF